MKRQKAHKSCTQRIERTADNLRTTKQQQKIVAREASYPPLTLPLSRHVLSCLPLIHQDEIFSFDLVAVLGISVGLCKPEFALHKLQTRNVHPIFGFSGCPRLDKSYFPQDCWARELDARRVRSPFKMSRALVTRTGSLHVSRSTGSLVRWNSVSYSA